ncbi:MAG: hypothetical protein R3F55_12540 [Alphaproteobacteria bacterium]
MALRFRFGRMAAAGILLAAGLGATTPASADLFGRQGTGETADGTQQSSAAPAFTAEDLVAALPARWHGTFAWDDGAAFFIELEIVKLTPRPDGEIAFNAESHWLPDGLQARMSGRIDPATLAVRIWEIADDASAADFESDGEYDGAFTVDLWELRARWQTTGTDESGTLVLIADAEPVQPTGDAAEAPAE